MYKFECKKCGWITNSKKMYWIHQCEVIKPSKDYSTMKRQDLLKELKEQQIPFTMSMKNTELIELLEGDK